MSSEEKYEKISFCQLIGMVTTNMLKHLDNMHGDTYLKIVQDYLDENPEIKKNDITSFYPQQTDNYIHLWLAGVGCDGGSPIQHC
jgi:hypothetical protein